MLNKLLKELKENKYTTIVFCLFLGLFLIAWIVYGMVMPKTGTPVYGNRLEGIEKVELTESDTSKIVKNLKDEDIVTSASTHLSGKILNVIVEVKDKTSEKKAKGLKKQAIETLTKEQLAFYDVQLFLTNENKEAKGYPIIGYKSSSEKDFAF